MNIKSLINLVPSILLVLGLSNLGHAANIVADTLYDFESFSIGATVTTADPPITTINAAVSLTAESGNGGTVLQQSSSGAGDFRMQFAGGSTPTSGSLTFDYALISTLTADQRITINGTVGELLRLTLQDNGNILYNFGNGSGGTTSGSIASGYAIDGSFNSVSISIDTVTDTWGFSVGSSSQSGLNFSADRDGSDVTRISFRATGASYVGQFDNVQFVTVPEPSTYVLVGSALILLAVFRRRRI
ncbi:MAG: PEP-CTERM sorting domain-containing protein [Verrucomicrobiota bacterium]